MPRDLSLIDYGMNSYDVDRFIHERVVALRGHAPVVGAEQLHQAVNLITDSVQRRFRGTHFSTESIALIREALKGDQPEEDVPMPKPEVQYGYLAVSVATGATVHGAPWFDTAEERDQLIEGMKLKAELFTYVPMVRRTEWERG